MTDSTGVKTEENGELGRFDAWLQDNGPAALVLREHLIPVEGPDGVLFPATFAKSEDGSFPGGYNIDTFASDKNVCLVDSVGSQANRMEPIFAKPEYAGLVPQIVVKAGDNRVNLLEASHRAGDAIVRCSGLQRELHDAFLAVLKGDAEPLAKIAPTSLVFGVWDSRDTQAKLPRLIVSTIRAFNVRQLTRSAQYIPSTDYVADGLLEEPGDLRDSENRVKGKHPFAKRGFTHVPASGAHGGVIAEGGIRRDASLSLAALRLLRAGNSAKKSLSLKRYILGLALTAFNACPSGYLRQGCNLVLDPENPRAFVEVYGDGRRVPATVTAADALKYATVTATDFGVGESREVQFDKEMAMKDIAASDGKGGKKSRGKKA